MMIYTATNGRVTAHNWVPGEDIPGNALWIDLHNLTTMQEKAVEDYLGIDVPSRAEMHEIEVSNRLYQEKGALYMTATLVTKVDTDVPENHSFTFIITEKHFITIRYTDPQPFRAFAAHLLRSAPAEQNVPAVFLGLVEAIINRMADVLERIGRELDATTGLIFRSVTPQDGTPTNHQQLLTVIGHNGDLASKTRESLVTLGRVVAYAAQNSRLADTDTESRFKAQVRDIAALSDHVAYLSNRVNFLLDATLGMINLEQNNIIKIFSVAAVVFLPPTLLASIYGMNFHHMPELGWHIGYPLALLLMVAAAVLPYFYFKRKKWL